MIFLFFSETTWGRVFAYWIYPLSFAETAFYALIWQAIRVHDDIWCSF